MRYFAAILSLILMIGVTHNAYSQYSDEHPFEMRFTQGMIIAGQYKVLKSNAFYFNGIEQTDNSVYAQAEDYVKIEKTSGGDVVEYIQKYSKFVSIPDDSKNEKALEMPEHGRSVYFKINNEKTYDKMFLKSGALTTRMMEDMSKPELGVLYSQYLPKKSLKLKTPLEVKNNKLISNFLYNRENLSKVKIVKPLTFYLSKIDKSKQQATIKVTAKFIEPHGSKKDAEYEHKLDAVITFDMTNKIISQIDLTKESGEDEWKDNNGRKALFSHVDKFSINGTFKLAADKASEIPASKTVQKLTITAAQKEWIMAPSAILMEINFNNHKDLGGDTKTDGNSRNTKRILNQFYKVKSKKQLIDKLKWHESTGYRAKLAEFIAQVEGLPKNYLEKVIKDMPGGLQKEMIKSIVADSKKFRQKSIYAYDYAFFVAYCRWGYMAGYLKEQEALGLLLHKARFLQKTFDSWKDFSDNYVMGETFTNQFRPIKETSKHISKLTTNSESPWKKHAWKTPIK